MASAAGIPTLRTMTSPATGTDRRGQVSDDRGTPPHLRRSTRPRDQPTPAVRLVACQRRQVVSTSTPAAARLDATPIHNGTPPAPAPRHGRRCGGGDRVVPAVGDGVDFRRDGLAQRCRRRRRRMDHGCARRGDRCARLPSGPAEGVAVDGRPHRRGGGLRRRRGGRSWRRMSGSCC